jgi:hypothetical protein
VGSLFGRTMITTTNRMIDEHTTRFFILAFQVTDSETRLNEKNRDWECVVCKQEVDIASG